MKSITFVLTVLVTFSIAIPLRNVRDYEKFVQKELHHRGIIPRANGCVQVRTDQS